MCPFTKRIACCAGAAFITGIAPGARADQLGVSLPVGVTATLTEGGPPNFADTFLTRYVATRSATIGTWKAQFVGGLINGVAAVPAGLQLKVFRTVIDTTEVEVVAEGMVHDPRRELQARFGGAYPFFLTERAVVQFVDSIRVEPGDIVGVTIAADRAAGAYIIPLTSTTGDTGLVLRSVGAGGHIDRADPFTATLSGLAPAIELIQMREVTIDIKPGSFPNSINLASAGSVPVAILGSDVFDATRVVPGSVSLAGAQVKLLGKSDDSACALDDVNGDGRIDLVCHVVTAQFMIEPGDAFAVVEARTLDGQNIRGHDSIRVVP
jgi:hypothetical protein